MKLTLKKNLASRRIAGELFIVDAAGSRLHELNGPAARIWEGLAAGRPEDDIVASVTGEFDTDEKTARADCRAFVRELLEAGLVTRSE